MVIFGEKSRRARKKGQLKKTLITGLVL